MSKLTALLGVDIVAESKLSGWHVDSVGVKNLVEGDTINLDAGLTIIETTRIFPREVDGGEVFAWEFEARALTPVKLLIVRAVDRSKNFEILGESPMTVPRQRPSGFPISTDHLSPCMGGVYSARIFWRKAADQDEG